MSDTELPALKVRVLNCDIDNLTWEESLLRFKKSKFIVTPNIDHLYNLNKNTEFFQAYQEADLVLCDSKILAAISPFFFKSRLIQIAGSDYFPAVCRYYNADPDIKIFLLGGTTPLHAKNAFANMKKKYNAPVIDYYSPPFGFEKEESELEIIVEKILASQANVIAVGLGSPKQELVISKLRTSVLRNCTFVAIGATIDFESGFTKRSPRFITKVGLEWFFRFAMEPKRLFKRYFINGPKVLFQLVRGKIHPMS